jgi:spectinomycin phosphotransferase
MLTRPAISDDRIFACLHDFYGLRITQVAFRPINVDPNCAVFRVTAEDGSAYFLKLRRWNANPVPVEVPAFLHAQGIRWVMAPLATVSQQLCARADGFTWLLYPFFEGRTGLQAGLSRAQWITLGRCMRAVHATVLPAGLAGRLPSEDFAPRWRRMVEAFHQEVPESTYDDPVLTELAAFWTGKRAEIDCILSRAERLAQALEQRTLTRVICHADLHGNNVLVGAHDELAVVDWDEPILAPKERDLMFIGGGVGGAWNQPQEATWFYEGYGPTEIDPMALAYSRYERIVEDFAAYGERILRTPGSAADREEGLRRLMSQFLPGNVVEMAHRSYPDPTE